MQTEETPAQDIDYESEWTSKVENLRREIVETETAIKQLINNNDYYGVAPHAFNLRIIFEDLMEFINSINVD